MKAIKQITFSCVVDYGNEDKTDAELLPLLRSWLANALGVDPSSVSLGNMHLAEADSTPAHFTVK